jgi:hypothetical protein
MSPFQCHIFPNADHCSYADLETQLLTLKVEDITSPSEGTCRLLAMS